MKQYIPESGDIIWLDLSPTRGREQAKVRPVLVLSPKRYNQKIGLAIICPITSVRKRYPFEVVVATGKVSGVVLSDHVRSVDWKDREIRFITTGGPVLVTEVLAKLTSVFVG